MGNIFTDHSSPKTRGIRGEITKIKIVEIINPYINNLRTILVIKSNKLLSNSLELL